MVCLHVPKEDVQIVGDGSASISGSHPKVLAAGRLFPEAKIRVFWFGTSRGDHVVSIVPIEGTRSHDASVVPNPLMTLQEMRQRSRPEVCESHSPKSFRRAVQLGRSCFHLMTASPTSETVIGFNGNGRALSPSRLIPERKSCRLLKE